MDIRELSLEHIVVDLNYKLYKELRHLVETKYELRIRSKDIIKNILKEFETEDNEIKVKLVDNNTDVITPMIDFYISISILKENRDFNIVITDFIKLIQIGEYRYCIADKPLSYEDLRLQEIHYNEETGKLSEQLKVDTARKLKYSLEKEEC